MKPSGNQYQGRKIEVLRYLGDARRALYGAAMLRAEDMHRAAFAMLAQAQANLASARARIDTAPASTRRRWLCGQ